MKNELNRIAVLLGLIFLSACKLGHQSDRDGQWDILEPSLDLNWQELVVKDSQLFQPNPGAAFLRENVDHLVGQLPFDIRLNPALSRLVINRFIDQPVAFQGGAIGKVGYSNVFVAEKRVVPDYDSLHRVIVATLSSRYGCLMKHRQKLKDTQHLFCRDGRKIEVARKQGPDWIQFVANQYDRNGYLIVVRDHQIVRRFSSVGQISSY